MASKRTELARKGEELAAKHLEQKGYEILEKNWRLSRSGEIDLIAKKDNIIVFIEVKTRSSRTCGDGLEAIDENKQQQIITLAESYIAQNPVPENCEFRFDAVSILISNNVKLNHLENAYTL